MKNIADIQLNKYKLIVSDVDGTLIGTNLILSSFTKQTIYRLRESGYLFTLATGKSLPTVKPLADELEIDLPLILINGGMIQTRQEQIFSQTTLPLDIVKKVISLCEAHKKDLIIYIENGIYIKEMTQNIYPMYKNVQSGLHEISEWNGITDKLNTVNKCLVADAFNRENLFEMENIFKDNFDGRVDVQHSSISLVEVMPKGITKVGGISKLAGSMGIAMDEIIAFGDFDNDAEMLSAVGLGVAVEGASPSALAAADIIVGPVSENGPAVFLNKLLDRCR